MWDIIIIGAGPAGLTAAIYARRARKKVLVLEANSYGGQIINAQDIDNYPAAPHINGYEFASNCYNQATELGAEIKFEKAINIISGDIKKVVTTSNSYETKTIIIATGCGIRKLGLDREDELLGKGVSYCAICDGAFFKDKDVAIIGGGNTAVTNALYMANLCSKVYLVNRGDSLICEKTLADKLNKLSNNIDNMVRR